MKAISLSQYGGPEVLKWSKTDIPKISPNEILIKIKAAGINPLDWKLREGIIKDRMQLPFILGCDVAGTIEEIGAQVSNFKKGDEVYAMLDMSKGGGYAQYVATDSTLVAIKPKILNFEEAASVPLASLTAWQALFDEAALQSQQKVLIHAASGGVGSFAVQIAKAKGLFVAASTSTKNIELVKSLGADIVIDYTKEDFTKHCQHFDMVLDPIGGQVQARSLQCLKQNGVLVTIVTLTCGELAKELNVKALRTLVKPDGKRLSLIARMIDDGKIKPMIDHVVTMEQIQEAHKLSQSGHARGKIVIKMSD